jgi:UDP-GlcNAc:undecaprenyl-phosphate GlcNAc-1-phosphate transferase
VYLACYGHYADEGTDKFRVVLCLSMVGAVLGFLPYNIPPASIFLGDAGSMLLGFFVAAMMILFAREGHLRWFLAACMIFALPIADTGLAVVRRVLSHKSVFAGDRAHLYDQLVDRGLSVKWVVALFYALSVLAATVGVLQAIFLRIRQAVMLDAAVAGVVIIIFVWKGMILPPPRQPSAPGGT